MKVARMQHCSRAPPGESDSQLSSRLLVANVSTISTNAAVVVRPLRLDCLNVVRVPRCVVSDGVSAAAPTARDASAARPTAGAGLLLRVFLERRYSVQDAGEGREDSAHAHVEASVRFASVLLHCGAGNLSHDYCERKRGSFLCNGGNLDSSSTLAEADRFWSGERSAQQSFYIPVRQPAR